jgi:hypothetical protein
VVSRANFVLNISITEYYLVLKNKYRSRSQSIRAAAHFDIVRAYSQIPTQSAGAKNTIGIYYSENYNP